MQHASKCQLIETTTHLLLSISFDKVSVLKKNMQDASKFQLIKTTYLI